MLRPANHIPAPAKWYLVADSMLNWLFLMAASASLLLLFLYIWPGASGAKPPTAALFRLSCHQIPSRCFAVKGVALPICARCLGVWLGIAAASLTAVTGLQRARDFLSRHAAFLVLLLVIDWTLGLFLIPASWKVERLITGFAGGLGITVILKKFIISWLHVPSHLKKIFTGIRD